MEKLHDTLVDLDQGTPTWFSASARLLPLALLAQFLGAGLALFPAADLWGLHAAVGMAIGLPVLALAGGAVALARLRGFGWWAGVVLVLYSVQVALAAGAEPLLLGLHPLNGALLFAASLVLLAKVERRRAATLRMRGAVDGAV